MIKQVVINVKGLLQRKGQRKRKVQYQRSITYSVRSEKHIQYATNNHPYDKEIMCKFMDKNPLPWVSNSLFMCTKLLVYVK